MRQKRSGDAARDLGDDIGERRVRLDLAAQREDQRHRRIEMRARDRPEDGDQHHQDRAGRQRVAEQRKRDIVGQPVGHDAGADDGRDQQSPCRALPRQGGASRSNATRSARLRQIAADLVQPLLQGEPVERVHAAGW